LKIKSKWALEWGAIIALVVGLQYFVGRNLPTGEPPSITASTYEGGQFDLSQLRGRPAVIYFWASWCPICRGMQSSVSAIAKDYPLISIALQSGNKAELGKYLDAHNFHIPTVSDEDGAITGRYGLQGVPALFVLGPEGKIRYATTGYTSELGIRIRLWLAGF